MFWIQPPSPNTWGRTSVLSRTRSSHEIVEQRADEDFPSGAAHQDHSARGPHNPRSDRMAMNDVSVVLAHGAWADGSSWARVVTALKGEGTAVVAAPLPLASLADDVAALNRSLERTEGPVVLAAHAY